MSIYTFDDDPPIYEIDLPDCEYEQCDECEEWFEQGTCSKLDHKLICDACEKATVWCDSCQERPATLANVDPYSSTKCEPTWCEPCAERSWDRAQAHVTRTTGSARPLLNK